ncbi:FmdB family zinc ribbon protein [Microbacterium indicum]|uniref:FmdB family zinc ribbon protein n=1 Tax=Microbacterium indicum TaxID=358100 RepID=UPI00040CA504|nr:FmdB family zinc ribbon protein [Microbacterium indicum]
MPTYSYACTQCGHAFDAVQSFSDDALTVCPECGGKLRKQYGSIGVTFRGSGFYRTDSRGSHSSSTGAGSDESRSSTASSSSAPAPASTSSGGAAGA